MVLVCLANNPAWAWGREGHQIIAGLAYAQLTPAAREQVDRLLALEPGETLESISTWADEHRSPATAFWHYVNFPRDSCHYEAERDCPDGRCVVVAIEKQTNILKSKISDEKRLQALKYLVHLVGDVHQPLHAGYRDDKGGNTYQLQAFMRGSNLHALWDTLIIAEMNEAPEIVVQRLMKSKPLTNTAEVPVEQAAQESCRIVGTAGFYPERRVGRDYVERFMPVLEQRLRLAGWRLAQLLNQMFG